MLNIYGVLYNLMSKRNVTIRVDGVSVEEFVAAAQAEEGAVLRRVQGICYDEYMSDEEKLAQLMEIL
jgi:hypothetical protein